MSQVFALSPRPSPWVPIFETSLPRSVRQLYLWIYFRRRDPKKDHVNYSCPSLLLGLNGTVNAAMLFHFRTFLCRRVQRARPKDLED